VVGEREEEEDDIGRWVNVKLDEVALVDMGDEGVTRSSTICSSSSISSTSSQCPSTTTLFLRDLLWLATLELRRCAMVMSPICPKLRLDALVLVVGVLQRGTFPVSCRPSGTCIFGEISYVKRV
jgi:hypothetical protein